MKVLKDVLRRNRAALIVFASATAVNAAVFSLYDLITEPLIYGSVLSLALLAALIAVDYIRQRRLSEERQLAIKAIRSDWTSLPLPTSLAEEDYQQMIFALGRQLCEVCEKAEAEKQDTLDYYTAWVHQIKTPIAVMRLKLSDGSREHLALSAELQRIEQYVDMTLQYIRINSETNDLVIDEYPLDRLIRESVRRQAEQFVEKKLRLCYEPTSEIIVTDQKWFSCILDQLLSNAVKYTPSGTVTVSVKDGLLTVSDTGIGIAPEDLPRVFEKGYTGSNGRLGYKSSGLGLYLAKKAADLLAIPITAESTPGKGSSFILDISQKRQG